MKPMLLNRLLPLLALSLAAAAQPVTFNLDPSQTQVHFRVDSTLHTVHGTFKLKSGSFCFDPATRSVSGSAVIDVASGDSGSGARDGRMHKEVLQSSKYPEAVFTVERLESPFALPAPNQEIHLAGSFSIHGAAHPMTLVIHTRSDSGKLIATTSFDVPYVAWGMKNPGNFLLKVDNIVHFEIDAVLHPAP